ncbi:MAG: tetratricopeptide repeat protein [Deltaproteobacteria bacterium]|jgi:tetratricopeptide (TPR) repeat protein|nr:tetratricopeptide repeat protein [Deltaproteobacteria bacterium]
MTTPEDRDSNPSSPDDFDSVLDGLEMEGSPAEGTAEGDAADDEEGDLLDWGDEVLEEAEDAVAAPADGEEAAEAAAEEPAAESAPAEDDDEDDEDLLDFAPEDLEDDEADAAAPEEPADAGGADEDLLAVDEPAAAEEQSAEGDDLLAVDAAEPEAEDLLAVDAPEVEDLLAVEAPAADDLLAVDAAPAAPAPAPAEPADEGPESEPEIPDDQLFTVDVPDDDLGRSFKAAFQSVQKSLGSDDAWNHLEDLADRISRPDDVADLYGKMLNRKLSKAVRGKLAERAVQYYQVWYVDSPERLTGLLSSIVRRDPDAEWAFERLTMMFTEAGQWNELLGVYDAVLVKTEDTKKRKRLLNDAAQVAKDFAHQAGRAADYMRQLLVHEPKNQKLITSLERLFEREARWDDLIDLWRELLPKLPVTQARATRLKIAVCSLEQLKKPERALEELAAIVSESPDDAEACARLESILSLDEAPLEARRQALSILRKTYEIVDRPDDIIGALERALGFVDDQEKRALRRELASRLAILGRDAEALEQYAELLRSDPADADARKQLSGLARRAELPDRHVAALVVAADATADTAQQVALLLDAAEIKRDELEDQEGAIELYQRVLALHETEPKAALAAAHHLNELLASGDRAADRLSVLEQLASLEQSQAIRRQLLGQAARLADELGDPDRALASWKPALDDDRPDAEALAAVIDLLERHERWQELAAVLERRATTTAMPLQRRADRRRIAEVQSDKLGDRASAIDSWEQVRKEFGEDAEITAALGDLLRAEERWSELAELLGEASSVRRENAAHLLNQLAEVNGSSLDQHAKAAELFGQALGVEPENETAREGLTKLLEREECRGAAARALAWAYDVTDDWQKTLELVEHRLAGARDAAAQVRVLTEAARLYEERAEDAAGAVRMLARALPLEPANLAIEEHLTRLGGVTGEWMEVAQALREAAEAATESPARAAELRIEEGELQENQLEDFAAALEAYQAAAELKPNDADRMEAVARVGARAGQWEVSAKAVLESVRLRDRVDPKVIETLETAAEGLGAWRDLTEALDATTNEAGDTLPNKLAAELEAKLASWYRERCEDVTAANAALRRALNHDPSDLDALRELAAIQRAEPGAHLVETLLLIDDGEEEGLVALREAAQVALEATDDGELRLSTLERLYRKATDLWTRGKEASGDVQPDAASEWALDALVELLVERKADDRAIQTLLEGAALPLPAAKAVELRRRAGGMLADKGDRLRAIEAYRAALHDAKDDLELVRRLAELSEQEEDVTGSVALRRRELELVDDVDERLELRLVGARRMGKLEGLTGRVAMLKANLEEKPAHPATVEALHELLSDRGRFTELGEVLDEQAKLMEEADDPARAAELRAQLAVLCEERLDDPDRAIQSYTRVVELSSTNEALDALARLHSKRGEPAKAAEWLEQRLESAAKKERVAVLLRLARVRIKAEQREPAVAVLTTAFEEAPRNAEVRKLLIRQHRRREDHKELARTLATAAEHATDESVVLSYAREAAEIYDEQLKTPAAAVPVLRKATEMAPDDRVLQSRLAEGLLASGELDEAEQLLTKLIKSFGRRGSKDRAHAHTQLARVYRGQGKADQAIAHLDAAGKMDPGNVIILSNFAELSRESGELDRAERGYRTLLLTVRRLPSEQRAKTPVGAAEVLLELSRIAADRGDSDQADELTESAIEALAEYDGDAPRLQARLLKEGAHDLLLRVLDARLGYVTSPYKRSQVFALRADVLETLERSAEALEARLSAVDAVPASPELHQAAWESADKAGELARYAAQLDTLLGKTRRETDAHARCELLLRMSEVHLKLHDDYDKAAEFCEAAAETGVREVDVLRARARLAGARGDEETQLAILEKLASLGAAEAETRTDALYRIAEVQLASDETLAAGIDSLATAFSEDGRAERAAAILRRASELYPNEERLLDLYEQVARKSNDDQLLMHYLERRALHPAAAPDHAREAVDKATSLDDEARAETLMLRAVEIGRGSDNLAAVDWALLALAERKKNAGDIAEAVKWLEEASEAVEPAAVFALGREVAAMAAQEGGDLTLAARLYERLLEREPTSREAWQPLAEIYRRLGDIDKLERVVNETLDGLQDPAERCELRVELANGLMAGGGREEEAVTVLQDVLNDDPAHEAAHAQLAEYWEKTGNTGGLIELLRKQLEAAYSAGEADGIRAAALNLGRRLEQHDPPEAAPVYRQALEAAGDSADLLSALLGRLGPEDGVEERASLTERLLTIEPGDDPGARALELCGLYESLSDEGGVQRALELGYRLAPENTTIRERLEQRFRDSGDWGGLAQMLLDAAEERDDDAGKATMLREAAAVFRDRLSDSNRAGELLRTALELAPKDPSVVVELATTLEGGGDRSAALEALTAALDDADDDQARLVLLQTRATMRGSDGDDAGAVEDLEAAFGIDAQSVAEQLGTALDAQRQQAIEAGDQEAERKATLRSIDVMRARADAQGALALLTGWLERSPDDLESLRTLREMQTEAQQWDGVIETCGRLLDLDEAEPLEKAALALQQAYDALGRTAEAREGLEKAREKLPGNAAIRGALRKLYEAAGAHRELAMLLIEEAHSLDDVEQKTAYLRWAGQTLVMVGDVEGAVPALREVLELQPEDVGARVSLADASIVAGQYDEADAILDEALGEYKGRRHGKEQAVFVQRKSHVARAKGDPDGQLALLQKAHQADNKNGEIAAELADLAELLEQWDAATKALRAITLIEGCRITPTQALIRQGRISLRQGDTKRAMMFARRAKRGEEGDQSEIDAFIAEVEAAGG